MNSFCTKAKKLNFKITSFSMRKWRNTENKTGPLQRLFSSNAPPLVLFCIETVPKVVHWLLKYNYSRWSGLFAAKMLDFESSIEVLNPNKMGIGEKSPTFIQNDFTPWCLKLNIFLKIRYGSQIVWPIFFNFIRTSK